MDTEAKVRGRRPLDERRLPRIDVIIDPELRREVRIAAAEDGVSLSEWMVRAARERLDRRTAGGEVST